MMTTVGVKYVTEWVDIWEVLNGLVDHMYRPEVQPPTHAELISEFPVEQYPQTLDTNVALATYYQRRGDYRSWLNHMKREQINEADFFDVVERIDEKTADALLLDHDCVRLDFNEHRMRTECDGVGWTAHWGPDAKRFQFETDIPEEALFGPNTEKEEAMKALYKVAGFAVLGTKFIGFIETAQAD